MIKVIVVRDLGLSPTGAIQCLVTDGTNFYKVSTLTKALDTGKPETLVFRCDATGKVTNFTGIAGGINRSREDAIIDLEARLNTGGSLNGRDTTEEWFDNGGFAGFLDRML